MKPEQLEKLQSLRDYIKTIDNPCLIDTSSKIAAICRKFGLVYIGHGANRLVVRFRTSYTKCYKIALTKHANNAEHANWQILANTEFSTYFPRVYDLQDGILECAYICGKPLDNLYYYNTELYNQTWDAINSILKTISARYEINFYDAGDDNILYDFIRNRFYFVDCY